MDAKERKAALQRKYRENNREKIRAYNAAYRQRNREEILEKGRAYYYANRERMIEYSTEYRKKNPGKTWRKKNPELAREKEAIYRAANRQKIREAARRSRGKNLQKERERKRLNEIKRRARKAGNGIFSVNRKDIQRLLNSPCANCGATSDIHVDHVIPIARGGRHSIGNLQALCAACNVSKGTKLYSEFRFPRRRVARAAQGGDSLR